MEPSSLDFFKRLLETPGPSGYEQRVQQVVREYAATFADEITTDSHGNVMLTVNPDAETTLMFAGHCDQIGLLISYIDDDGYLYAQTIGGWDPQQLIGQQMTVWTEQGPVAAVISRKPIHLLNEEERKTVVKERDMWLDIGARDKKQASERVRVGDPVTLKLGFQPLLNDLACAPAMDNRTGLWTVVEALRRCRELKPTCKVVAVSTVQEEIGLRGATTSAFQVQPDVAIAVDVTHATDCPTIDKKQQGQVSLGSGPVVFRGPNINPRVSSRLRDLASEYAIPIQLAAVARATPNDANPIQISRGGVATGLVAIPNRYMHSAVETISLADIDQAANLLAQFAASVTKSCDWIPRWD
ncbi:MAG: M42 family metallopeptidase [Planctomycetales bacterium]|nr:M42 family metallopeptidase [Planctomycetales bacterium]